MIFFSRAGLAGRRGMIFFSRPVARVQPGQEPTLAGRNASFLIYFYVFHPFWGPGNRAAGISDLAGGRRGVIFGPAPEKSCLVSSEARPAAGRQGMIFLAGRPGGPTGHDFYLGRQMEIVLAPNKKHAVS